MTGILFLIAGLIIVYLLLSLFFTYLVHQVPRKPVSERPEWGKVSDARIPAKDGGFLEVWRVEPAGPSRGVVVLAHGWSRNRDRMVMRARVFGKMGFTTVFHSARDHGGSSPHRYMNAPRFAEDIEAVLNWVGSPVVLYGHSIGAAAAVIAAHQNPGKIQILFLESCYARTREALLSIYRGYHWFFGTFFGPMVILWMEVFYRRGLDTISPVKLAPSINLPVLIIHGGKDESFPLHHALRVKESFPPGRAELFVAKDADHSSPSLDPDYPRVIQSFVDRRLG